MDLEALAAGAEPLIAPDASEHARRCADCGAAVARAATLIDELDAGKAAGAMPDLSARVLRLRPFSARERVSFRLWGPPLLLSASVFAAGVFALAPALAASEQMSLLFSAAAGAALVARAAVHTLADLVSTAPAGLSAVSEAFRADRMVGLAALALLLPAGFGLRRALARARR